MQRDELGQRSMHTMAMTTVRSMSKKIISEVNEINQIVLEWKLRYRQAEITHTHTTAKK